MTRILIVFAIFIGFNHFAFGQVEVRSDECFGIVKKDEAYIIRLNGNDYEDNDYAYICKNDLVPPLSNIELLYKDNGMPVQGSHWEWDKCECQAANPNDHTAFINFDHFEGDNKLTIKVRFRETSQDFDQTGDEIDLKLNVRLIENLEINESQTSQVAQYAFDENKIKEYNTYSNGIPYKVIIDGLQDNVIFDDNKSEDYYQNLNITSFSTMDGQNSNIITEFDAGNRSLEISHIANNNNTDLDILYNHSLCDDEEILVSDIQPAGREIVLYVYELQESDDDIANYCTDWEGENENEGREYQVDCETKITSKHHQCILPGEDGSLDLFANLKSWVSPLDKIVGNGNFAAKVTAGENLKCDTDPRENNIHDFSTSHDLSKLEQDLNAIYNKLDINFTLEPIVTIPANYDSFKEDNIMNDRELTEYHLQLFGNEPSQLLTLWLVPGLISNNTSDPDVETDILRGRAAALGFNTLAINEADIVVDRTLGHEIGHARFSLYHPDQKIKFNNELVPPPNQNGITSKDKYNVMNSGYIQSTTTQDILKFRWRKYQWDTIRDNY